MTHNRVAGSLLEGLVRTPLLAVLSSILLLSQGLKPYRESVVRLQNWAAEPA